MTVRGWKHNVTPGYKIEVREKIENLKHDDLIEIFAEIECFKIHGDPDGVVIGISNGFDEETFDAAKRSAKWKDRNILVSAVKEYAWEIDRANGNLKRVHICPFGCHKISMGE